MKTYNFDDFNAILLYDINNTTLSGLKLNFYCQKTNNGEVKA